MSLIYHQNAFDLMPLAPRFSAERAAEVTLFELQYGLKLPAAYRELYCLGGIREFLFRYGNQDDFLTLENYGKHEEFQAYRQRDKMFVFSVENQYTAFWAFPLNGADNPPVFVAYDADELIWQPLTDTLSEYFFLWAWDTQPAGQGWYWAQLKLTGRFPGLIAAIEQHFPQAWPVKTYDPPRREFYRFAGRTPQQSLSVLLLENEAIIRLAAAADVTFYAQIRSVEQALSAEVRGALHGFNSKTRAYLNHLNHL